MEHLKQEFFISFVFVSCFDFFARCYNYVPPYEEKRWGVLFVFITSSLTLSLGFAFTFRVS